MPDACSTDLRKPKRVAVPSKGAGRARRVGGIQLQTSGTGFCPGHSVGRLRLVSRSNALAPVCTARRPARPMIGVGRRPGDARTQRSSRKVHTLEGKLESALGARGSAVIIGVGVASPGTRSRRGIRGSSSLLNADLVVSILPAASFRREEDEPGADKAVLKAIVLPATRPPTTATARRKRRSVKRGQSVSGGERHPLLRFQHYFQPPTQPHGPREEEATVASNGLTGAIYAGGQKVDYVAFAVAELAPLILAFGRGCENGSSYRSTSSTRRPLRRHAPQTGGPRQLYRSSAPTGEQMDIE